MNLVFRGDGALYESVRPGYPASLLNFPSLIESARRREHIVDVGAGTGKLTARLMDLGFRVTALEPSTSMRAAMARALPAALILSSTCEEYIRKDGRGQSFTFGQSVHYLSPSTLGKIVNTMPVGGHLLVANNHPLGNDWLGEVSGYWRSITPQSSNPVSQQLHFLRSTLGPANTRTVKHELSLSAREALNFLHSLSSFAHLSKGIQHRVLDAGAACLARHREQDGTITFRFRGEAHLWQKK